MIAKSDFLLFLKSPMHLWADKHNKLNNLTPSVYDQHLMKQGYEVETLAHKLLPHAIWQETFISNGFESRSDALIKNTDDTYDLYEVKSTTKVEKEHLYDATFQYIVKSKTIKINKVYVVNLNKEYILSDSLNIKELFQINDVTNEVMELTIEIQEKMMEAEKVAGKDTPDHVETCLDPKSCPCISLCHPNLPEKSIYHIPALHPQKKRELKDSRILEIKDIPDSFPLSPKQTLIKNIIKSNTPYLNATGLSDFLNTFVFPIYFLDYETYPLAIPIYKGYKPYQHMVFQYSLHIVESDGTMMHQEYLETELGDPSVNLIKKLKEDIKDAASVVVWNKTFEFERNKDIAGLYPEYKEFLDDVNSRMIDLADFINKELYIHPDFLGSWSIKNVLPVMVPDLSYKKLAVNKGDQAMLVWWELIHTTDKSKAKELLEYCGLDTLAMVKIWEKLKELI